MVNKDKKITPPGEMTDIDVDFISLVRKGANGQRVQIYKADEDEIPDNDTKSVGGFMKVMREFFVGKADDTTAESKPKRSVSFTQSIAVSDIMNSMWRVNDTLREVMRNIIADDSITDKKASLSQAIDDYATYMKGKINSTAIAKADFFDEPESKIEKAGRTLSEKSLTSIKNAIAALQSLLGEADGGNIQKGDDFDMSNEEIKNIMKSALDEALKPVTERLDALEKGDTSDEGAQGTQGAPENDTGAENNDNISEVVKAAVSEAVKPIQERLDKVEKARGTARGLEDEGGKSEVEKSADVFDGYFI